jgi:hypothetical protein
MTESTFCVRGVTARRAATLVVLVSALLAGTGRGAAPDPAAFRAGVACRVITPPAPMWMAGYANRNHPAEGKVHDLYVKALAIESASGRKLVLVATDLLGLPRDLSVQIADDVRRRTGLSRECLMLTSSHTHCGPVLRGPMADMHDMPPEEFAKVGPYTDELRHRIVETVVRALDDLKPARLAIGKGTARFAVNRREPTPKGIINGYNPKGPVDHDVPVLRVTTPEGKLRAVVFGYACHNTTMQFYRWCGDYAGFAQAYLEDKHPGAVALFWIGCGGDANPLPRSKLELCQKYGRELADAVEGVLAHDMRPLSGPVRARYETVALPFDKLPGKDAFAADLLSKSSPLRKRAAHYLKILEAGGKIDATYPHYPVQVWRFGDDLVWVALGGEVVVDYDLRLKRELGGPRAVWITGYANDVMAYIPSERVLREGGYEGDTSMVFYAMPTKWGTGIEEIIVGKVRELAK